MRFDLTSTDYQKLLRHASFYCHHDAEEAVQEACIQLLRYTGEVPQPLNWLRTAARFSALKLFRSQKRRQAAEFRMWAAHEWSMPPVGEDRCTLADVVKRVPVHYQSVLASEVLGTPSTITGAAHRNRLLRLRAVLQGLG